MPVDRMEYYYSKTFTGTRHWTERRILPVELELELPYIPKRTPRAIGSHLYLQCTNVQHDCSVLAALLDGDVHAVTIFSQSANAWTYAPQAMAWMLADRNV